MPEDRTGRLVMHEHGGDTIRVAGANVHMTFAAMWCLLEELRIDSDLHVRLLDRLRREGLDVQTGRWRNTDLEKFKTALTGFKEAITALDAAWDGDVASDVFDESYPSWIVSIREADGVFREHTVSLPSFDEFVFLVLGMEIGS